MTTRRSFLRALAGFAATGAAYVSLRDDSLNRLRAAGNSVAGRPAERVASDEDYWREIQAAFTVNRNVINLNNGGVCPSPRVVQQAMRRFLEFSNQTPAYNMWRIQEPQKENVRRDLARLFHTSPEQIAIVRNATEALETATFGLDLEASTIANPPPSPTIAPIGSASGMNIGTPYLASHCTATMTTPGHSRSGL